VLADVLEEVDRPAQAIVEVVDHPRVGLHVDALQGPLLLAERIPRTHHRMRLGNLGGLGEHAHTPGPRQPPLLQHLVAVVVAALVLTEPRLGHVHWVVRGGKSQVGEERSAVAAILANRVHEEVGVAPARVEVGRQLVQGLAVEDQFEVRGVVLRASGVARPLIDVGERRS
jgi:hypothetical protein